MCASPDGQPFPMAPETRLVEPAGSDTGADRTFNSPACSMHEAGDTYLGFAGPDEVYDALRQLLEIERAAVWVSLESAHAAASSAFAEMLRTIQHDEERWCAVLQRHIAALGRQAPMMGSFYETAMAIEDLGRRLAFLNRGQSWVVKKLRELLPRVRDDALHADLDAMLRSHEANITAAEAAWRDGSLASQEVTHRQSV